MSVVEDPLVCSSSPCVPVIGGVHELQQQSLLGVHKTLFPFVDFSSIVDFITFGQSSTYCV